MWGRTVSSRPSFLLRVEAGQRAGAGGGHTARRSPSLGGTSPYCRPPRDPAHPFLLPRSPVPSLCPQLKILPCPAHRRRAQNRRRHRAVPPAHPSPCCTTNRTALHYCSSESAAGARRQHRPPLPAETTAPAGRGEAAPGQESYYSPPRLGASTAPGLRRRGGGAGRASGRYNPCEQRAPPLRRRLGSSGARLRCLPRGDWGRLRGSLGGATADLLRSLLPLCGALRRGCGRALRSVFS